MYVTSWQCCDDTWCSMFSRQQLRQTIWLLWQEQKTCTVKAWSRYDDTAFSNCLCAIPDSFLVVLCVYCEHVNGEQQLRDSICVFSALCLEFRCLMQQN